MTAGTCERVVGFIGIGAIGRPIVERMVEAGHDLVVHDVRLEACAPLADRAAVAGSPAEVASRADVVFACLPSIRSYRDAVLGDGGIAHGRRADVYVHIGTTGPALVEDIAEALSSRGIDVLDAPMTGGTPRAHTGTLTVMAAGAQPALDAAGAAIGSYATRVVHLGTQPGMAQTTKLINNMVSAANLAIACEGLALAARAGLDLATVVDVLNAGTGQNSATLTKIPNHVLPRSFDYGSGMRITLKDLRCYMDEAGRRGVHTEVAAAVRRCYEAAAGRLGADTDMTEVMRFIETAGGPDEG